MKDYSLPDFISLIKSEEERIYSIKLESQTLIKKEFKKLTLKGIIQKENLEGSLFDKIAEDTDHRFELGNKIPFKIYPFDFLLSPTNLRLFYSHILLREFKGTHIKRLYNFMAEKILEATEVYLDNLPF